MSPHGKLVAVLSLVIATAGLAGPWPVAVARAQTSVGYPITPARPEVSRDTGQTYLTQWFERARFEWHPNNPEAHRVLLGLLGTEVRQATATLLAPAPLTAAHGD